MTDLQTKFNKCQDKWSKAKLLWNLSKDGLEPEDIRTLLPGVGRSAIRCYIETYDRFKGCDHELTLAPFTFLSISRYWHDAEEWVYRAVANGWSPLRMKKERKESLDRFDLQQKFNECSGDWERAQVVGKLAESGLSETDIRALLPDLGTLAIRYYIETFERFKGVYVGSNSPEYGLLEISREWDDAEHWISLATSHKWSPRWMRLEREKSLVPPAAQLDEFKCSDGWQFTVTRLEADSFQVDKACKVILPSGKEVWLFEDDDRIWAYGHGVRVQQTYEFTADASLAIERGVLSP